MSKEENPLIIALDTPSPLKALSLVKKLKVTGVAFKVGFELFCSAGPRLIEKIVGHDVRVFLDLKFHDIPNTVANAARVATKMGVWMFNVHALGGSDMLKAAYQASVEESEKNHIEKPLVTAVTILTSHREISSIGIEAPIQDQVIHLAKLAQEQALDGVVASAEEASFIRHSCGKNFKIVSPGIRLDSQNNDDQSRVMTPSRAVQNGSDYLVMGRPILQSKKPVQTITDVIESIGG